MQYVLVIHKVEDYEKWKPIYDEHTDARMDKGSKGAHVLRNADNPNEIVLLFEWDNLDNARKFYESQDLRNTMQNAGVMGKPEIRFLDGIGRTSA
ncbi:MAG TPA: cyclase [Methanobacterium sp.]|nr:cyclase [Methanobacterium sp.]